MIHSLFLVNHSLDLPVSHAALIFAVGFAAIFINYDAGVWPLPLSLFHTQIDRLPIDDDSRFSATE